MRSFETLAVGLLAGLAQAAPASTKAQVEDCLAAAKVPFDVKNSTEWIRDATAFNLRVPFNPNAIAVPQTIDHIRKAVLCGRALGVKVTPKSGGHSYASLGFGGENGHLVVELDRMYAIQYDAATEVATIETGARLGHVSTVLFNENQRAIAHGTCPGVGLGGHYAHGGFGFSSHKHGLALDQVVGVTVVLADGSVVEASATKNADLFWGVRGAGSNFGIIANWKIKTFAAPTTLTSFNINLGMTKENGVRVLEAIEKYGKTAAPANINFRVGSYPTGEGRPGPPTMEGLFYGTDAELRKELAPVLEQLGPQANLTDTTVWKDWYEMVTYYGYSGPNIDWTYPSPNENFYSKSLAIEGLNGTAAKAFSDYFFDEVPKYVSVNRTLFVQLDLQGGKYSKIAERTNADTAYAHRDKLYLIQFYDRIANDKVFPFQNTTVLDNWVNGVTAKLPAGTWGAYANYADAKFTKAEAQAKYYGANLGKLKKLKAKFDPTDLFYSTQGISACT